MTMPEYSVESLSGVDSKMDYQGPIRGKHPNGWKLWIK
jgi:hypothetical protein